MSCWMVVEPMEGIHFDEGLFRSSIGMFPKAHATICIRRGDSRVVPPIFAEQTVSMYVLEEPWAEG